MINYINLVRAPSGDFHLAVFTGDTPGFHTLCGREAVPNPDLNSTTGWQDTFMAFPFWGHMCLICFKPKGLPPRVGAKTQT